NNKLVHFATYYTPKEATKQENELKVYVNLKLKAKETRNYLELSDGDKLQSYSKRKPSDKSDVSVCSSQAYKIEPISHAHGLT
ncbi:MAG: hypothetical protein ACKPKO_25155, partial [Candidatus Fonsibacter sp.]